MVDGSFLGTEIKKEKDELIIECKIILKIDNPQIFAVQYDTFEDPLNVHHLLKVPVRRKGHGQQDKITA